MTKRRPLGNTVRFEIFKRDNFTCQYCGATPPDAVLEVDHVTPVSKGGSNEVSNLVTACFECNRGKRDKTLGESFIEAKELPDAKVGEVPIIVPNGVVNNLYKTDNLGEIRGILSAYWVITEMIVTGRVIEDVQEFIGYRIYLLQKYLKDPYKGLCGGLDAFQSMCEEEGELDFISQCKSEGFTVLDPSVTFSPKIPKRTLLMYTLMAKNNSFGSTLLDLEGWKRYLVMPKGASTKDLFKAIDFSLSKIQYAEIRGMSSIEVIKNKRRGHRRISSVQVRYRINITQYLWAIRKITKHPLWR